MWEVRSESGAVTRQVWRHGGFEEDTDEGVTLQVLPMARLVDGDLFWLAQEPDGRAPWVYTDLGAEHAFEVLGATGESLVHVGAEPWHQDHMHGAQIDRSIGLVHHGVRHARVSDGLWMQPEPLLYLGVASGSLALPRALGPIYAVGDTNALMDRSGFFQQNADGTMSNVSQEEVDKLNDAAEKSQSSQLEHGVIIFAEATVGVDAGGTETREAVGSERFLSDVDTTGGAALFSPGSNYVKTKRLALEAKLGVPLVATGQIHAHVGERQALPSKAGGDIANTVNGAVTAANTGGQSMGTIAGLRGGGKQGRTMAYWHVPAGGSYAPNGLDPENAVSHAGAARYITNAGGVYQTLRVTATAASTDKVWR
ncbi:MAG: hypothetical protein ACI9K2_006912 [Myxococcota bacterium]